MLAAYKLFTNWSQILPCSAHRLNTSVNDILAPQKIKTKSNTT